MNKKNIYNYDELTVLKYNYMKNIIYFYVLLLILVKLFNIS